MEATQQVKLSVMEFEQKTKRLEAVLSTAQAWLKSVGTLTEKIERKIAVREAEKALAQHKKSYSDLVNSGEQGAMVAQGSDDVGELFHAVPVYVIGQRFIFLPGQLVTCNGHPGTVYRMYSDGMVEVRLPGGLTCVSASYPDCYPRASAVEIVRRITSRSLVALYPVKGSMPLAVIEQLFAIREKEVAKLSGQVKITVGDLTSLDRGARTRVASELFSKCDDDARYALLHDEHHFVRSAAELSQASLTSA